MEEYQQRIQDRLREFIGSLNRRALETERADAKADPLAHKLTRVMEGEHGLSYHHLYAGQDGRGRYVWFCWAVHRNAAGFFLGWREVYNKRTRLTKRDQWLSRRKRKAVEAVAERRVAAFRARQVKAGPAAS